MPETVIIAIVGAATGIVGAIVGAYATIKRLTVETRKANVDANHTAVNAAGDAFTILKSAYDQRIEQLERQVKGDRTEIVSLTRMLGDMRCSGEAQSKRIDTMQDHIDELTGIVRQAGLKLPTWAVLSGGEAVSNV